MLSENPLVIARSAIESTYFGECDVVEYRKVKDPTTKITSNKEVRVLEGIPCRLSFSEKKAAERSETVTGISGGAKLFISPDIEIKTGSKIVVRQDNMVREFCASGVPAVYPTHCEIELELFEKWS